ncbi:MAG TPA: MFS transporter, partial [Candidatus Polarisedimenticolia bacterium]|nr:MFS transporter [Candidatus Polarisedimenticolia bacterium]
IYRVTGSELLLGLAGFADKIPVFVLGLAGGLVADRFDRHRIVIATQTTSMVQALVLGLLVVSGLAPIWLIFVLITLQGVINAFDLPARQSFIAAMVEQDDLPNALALNSSVFNAARVVGPAMAGVLVAAVGEGPCFLINGVSYVAVLVCLLKMRFDARQDRATGGSTFGHLAGGIRFAGASPPVRSLLLLIGLTSVFGMPFMVLMPVFAGEILGGGARALGTLMGASGVGAFLAAVVLARRRTVQGLGRVVAGGSIGFGLTLLMFSTSRSIGWSVLVLVGVGFTMIMQAAATNLLLQSLCPDGLRGRIMSLYTIMFVGMAPWGSLLAGTSAHGYGAPATVAAGGILCAIGGIAFAVRIPYMRRFVRYPIPETPLPRPGSADV